MPPHPHVRLTAVALALGTAFAQAQPTSPPPSPAARPELDRDQLPDLAGAGQKGGPAYSFSAGGDGAKLDRRDANSRLSTHVESSQRTGSAIGITGGMALGDTAALGGGIGWGTNKREVFANLGWNIDAAQRRLTAKAAWQRADALQFIFDFWAVHPFADGNGRLASLLADVICLNHHLAPLALDRKDRLFYTALMENLSRGAPIEEQLYLVFVPLLNFEWVMARGGVARGCGSRAGEARRSEPLRHSPGRYADPWLDAAGLCIRPWRHERRKPVQWRG